MREIERVIREERLGMFPEEKARGDDVFEAERGDLADAVRRAVPWTAELVEAKQ